MSKQIADQTTVAPPIILQVIIILPGREENLVVFCFLRPAGRIFRTQIFIKTTNHQHVQANVLVLVEVNVPVNHQIVVQLVEVMLLKQVEFKEIV